MGIIIPVMGIKKQESLANTLFSRVQQRVLALFFGNPERSYYTNEIIRLTNSGTGAVQRELSKLSSVGLILVQNVGNQKVYVVNKDSNIFNELRDIVIKTFGMADVISKALDPVISQISVAFIYGSIAKHEDKVNSDIDLMIIGNDLSYADLYTQLESVNEKLKRQVNPTFYTPTEWARKHKEGNNFIVQVMAQPKIFIVGNDDELASIG